MGKQNNPMEDKDQQSKNINIKTIHTYQTDMAEAVRDNEISVIKIAMAEQKKRERDEIYRKAEGNGFTKSLFAIGGIILLAGASLSIYFVTQKNKIANAPLKNEISKNIETIISYDNQSFLDSTSISSSVDFVKLMRPEIEKEEKQDSIKSIFLTKSINNKSELLTLNDFIKLMNFSAPNSLTRSLSDPYMIGTYTPNKNDVDNKPHLFLLFNVKDYSIVYAGMLQWEKNLLANTYNIFNIDIATDSNILETPFKDIIVGNKDGRVLYDKNGNIILYYLFINKNNLIITDNENTIRKIDTRLLIKQTKPL